MPNPPIPLGPDVETNLQFYTCTARALLTFMHDDGSTGHLRISDLVFSPYFRDFMTLRHPGATVCSTRLMRPLTMLSSQFQLAHSLRSLQKTGSAPSLFRKFSNSTSRLTRTKTVCCRRQRCAGSADSHPRSSRVCLRCVAAVAHRFS